VTSIVIAAHDEETVIGRCLDSIQQAAAGDEFEVIVVANGCTDSTIAQAESRKVRVIELAESGKAQALNVGDAVASRFPRLYLDADMVVSADDIRALSRSLCNSKDLLACAPKRKIKLDKRPLAVRAFFRIQTRLPVYQNGLVGRGAIMVSEAGRARFTEFPDETADDLFLDSLFGLSERMIVDGVTCTIEGPYTTKDLLRRIIRVRRGNIQLRQSELTISKADQPMPRVRRSDPWSWLRDVVVPHPTLAPAGIVFATLTLIAEWQARRSIDKQTWGRDESTRRSDKGKGHAKTQLGARGERLL
jgi:glycosyltransferase involved in cell wall biosynthesis